VYAADCLGTGIEHQARVKLLAAWTDRASGEAQIEVMSDEPLLMQGSRCEQTAAALQKLLPPKQKQR